MLQDSISELPDNNVVFAKIAVTPQAKQLQKIYTRYGFKKDPLSQLVAARVGTLRQQSRRSDAAGKPWGSFYIPRSYMCSKGSGTLTPQSISIDPACQSP